MSRRPAIEHVLDDLKEQRDRRDQKAYQILQRDGRSTQVKMLEEESRMLDRVIRFIEGDARALAD